MPQCAIAQPGSVPSAAVNAAIARAELEGVEKRHGTIELGLSLRAAGCRELDTAELSLRRRAMFVLLADTEGQRRAATASRHGKRWIAEPYVTPLHNQEDNSRHQREQLRAIRSRH